MQTLSTTDLSMGDAYFVNTMRWLLPKKCRLHACHIIDRDLLDLSNDDSADWAEYAHRRIEDQIGRFIADSKTEAFSQRHDYNRGVRHEMSLIVMTPQEFAKYQSDLLAFVKQNKYEY